MLFPPYRPPRVEKLSQVCTSRLNRVWGASALRVTAYALLRSAVAGLSYMAVVL